MFQLFRILSFTRHSHTHICNFNRLTRCAQYEWLSIPPLFQQNKCSISLRFETQEIRYLFVHWVPF